MNLPGCTSPLSPKGPPPPPYSPGLLHPGMHISWRKLVAFAQLLLQISLELREELLANVLGHAPDAPDIQGSGRFWEDSEPGFVLHTSIIHIMYILTYYICFVERSPASRAFGLLFNIFHLYCLSSRGCNWEIHRQSRESDSVSQHGRRRCVAHPVCFFTDSPACQRWILRHSDINHSCQQPCAQEVYPVSFYNTLRPRAQKKIEELKTI